MKSTTLILTALVSLVLLGGCALVGEPVAEKVADVVGDYCVSEPLAARELYRTTINAELADGAATCEPADGRASCTSIEVTCAGDPAPDPLE